MGGTVLRIEESVNTYSSVFDNPVYPLAEDAGWSDETQNLTSDSAVYRDVPDYAAIPAEKIGRY